MSTLFTRTALSLALLGLLASGQTAHAGPSSIDGISGTLDKAASCLSRTTVSYFTASRTMVAPFASTTLSWSANVPADCSVSFKVAGVSVGKTGSLTVTPIHASSTYSLRGSMLGVTGSLASVAVSVDMSTCHSEIVAEALLAPRIASVIDEVDAEDDDFYQVDEPAIWIEDSGLFVTLFIKGAHWWWDPSIDLEMGLRFYAKNGVVYPRWIKYLPVIDSSLPDDEVSSEVFAKAGGILARFKDGLNAAFAADLLEEGEKIFDVDTAFAQMLVTVCKPRTIVRFPRVISR